MTPTLDQVKRALRIDGPEFDDQIPDLIAQAHAEMLAKLDRNVYESEEALAAADDEHGLVATKDMIQAQSLLIGAYLDRVGSQEAGRMRSAASSILDRHRLSGA